MKPWEVIDFTGSFSTQSSKKKMLVYSEALSSTSPLFVSLPSLCWGRILKRRTNGELLYKVLFFDPLAEPKFSEDFLGGFCYPAVLPNVIGICFPQWYCLIIIRYSLDSGSERNSSNIALLGRALQKAVAGGLPGSASLLTGQCLDRVLPALLSH